VSSRGRLSPAHRRMLFKESGIGARVAVKRGYRTVTSKVDLERLGFGRSQRNVPALLMPIYSPTWEIVLYQSRPNEPRIGKRGKPIKYETPSGASMILDVHPFCRERLKDPTAPLFITEEIKKGDALASRNLCAVALIGVWNWRGRTSTAVRRRLLSGSTLLSTAARSTSSSTPMLWRSERFMRHFPDSRRSWSIGARG